MCAPAHVGREGYDSAVALGRKHIPDRAALTEAKATTRLRRHDQYTLRGTAVSRAVARYSDSEPIERQDAPPTSVCRLHCDYNTSRAKGGQVPRKGALVRGQRCASLSCGAHVRSHTPWCDILTSDDLGSEGARALPHD